MPCGTEQGKKTWIWSVYNLETSKNNTLFSLGHSKAVVLFFQKNNKKILVYTPKNYTSLTSDTPSQFNCVRLSFIYRKKMFAKFTVNLKQGNVYYRP